MYRMIHCDLNLTERLSQCAEKGKRYWD